jgi:hypothetical protein
MEIYKVICAQNIFKLVFIFIIQIVYEQALGFCENVVEEILR